MTAAMIEDRLDRHANFFYCSLTGGAAQGCNLSYKIIHILANGTEVALTGYPTS
jgi:hypothetical protein